MIIFKNYVSQQSNNHRQSDTRPGNQSIAVRYSGSEFRRCQQTVLWKDKDGAKKKTRSSITSSSSVVKRKQPDNTCKKVSVLVEGRMQTRSWDDKRNGEKKYRTEIVADRVQFGQKPEAKAIARSARQDRQRNLRQRQQLSSIPSNIRKKI